jgi:hypothetical protein
MHLAFGDTLYTMALEIEMSSLYEEALYAGGEICPAGANWEPLQDGTHELRDRAALSNMVWQEVLITAHPELPKIECEIEPYALELDQQASAESQKPEKQRRRVRSGQSEQHHWFSGPAPWKPFLKPAAPEAPKGGKPRRKKPAAATRTASDAGKPVGKPPRKKPAAATPTVQKLALTPDEMSELRKDVDRDIAALKDKKAQFCKVVNGKVIAAKQISKNMPSGSLLCIYGNSWHRAAGSRPKTRATGPDRLARSLCMCTKHLREKCLAITTAAPKP